MDSFFEEIGRGFFRGIGYILVEVFFRTVCYWVGWPICQLATLGKYPSASKGYISMSIAAERTALGVQ